MAYATVADLQKRWKHLDESETEVAGALLDDASVMVDSVAGGNVSADAAKAVVCAMVKRAMMADELDAFGVSQTSMTGGPYSQSVSFANPSGDLYITKAEQRMLGVGVGRVGVSRSCLEVETGGDADEAGVADEVSGDD